MIFSRAESATINLPSRCKFSWCAWRAPERAGALERLRIATAERLKPMIYRARRGPLRLATRVHRGLSDESLSDLTEHTMKLAGFLNNVFKVVAHELEAPAAKHQAHVRRPKVHGDGFEVARRAPVDLGRSAPASAASDRGYVTGLYHALLGREPDADGLKAHLNGLRTGMSRDEIRQVFLTSPEYRAKLNATPTPAPEPVGKPPLTGVDQLKQLIAADLMTAGGRVATDADFSYWLPMLQSPCDSGFVTSGQMSGVEYYHRRMLGWQAGGSDQATRGPYAGSSDANGPVPSATDVMSQA